MIRVLMLGTPPTLDAETVLADMKGHEGVEGVHHLHVWMMQENQPALSAHVVTTDRSGSIRKSLKIMLNETHGLVETILEIEHPSDSCAHAEIIGHGTSLDHD